MLNLTAEEWASLRIFPPAAKMFDQIQRQVAEETADIAIHALCMGETADKTVMNYATAVGRLAAMTEILEYEPYPDMGVGDDDNKEQEGV